MLIVVSLTMIAYAHKPVGSLPASVQYAAYTLPDGTLPVLCVTDNGEPDSKGSMKNYGCDACRLSATALTADVPVLVVSAIEFPATRCVHCSEIPEPETADISSARPRAPPQAA